MASSAEKRYMGRIAALDCVVCEMLGMPGTPAQVHHIREGRIARNDWLTLPLCPAHHTGTHASVHQAKPALLRMLNVGSEFDLLARTIERLNP